MVLYLSNNKYCITSPLFIKNNFVYRIHLELKQVNKGQLCELQVNDSLKNKCLKITLPLEFVFD